MNKGSGRGRFLWPDGEGAPSVLGVSIFSTGGASGPADPAWVGVGRNGVVWIGAEDDGYSPPAEEL